jgi:hypothetical protein
MSSGSIFTLLNFKIYYLSNVNYDLAATDLISIRVSIYLRPGEGEEAGQYREGRRASTGGRWAGPT